LLYLLKEISSTKRWYDSFDSFVVRAQSEDEARQLAQRKIADESRIAADFWLNPVFSSCNELHSAGRSEIVLGSFNAA